MQFFILLVKTKFKNREMWYVLGILLGTLRNSIFPGLFMSLSQARLMYRLTVILCALSQGLVSLWMCVVGMTLDHGDIVGASEAQPLFGLGLKQPPKLTLKAGSPVQQHWPLVLYHKGSDITSEWIHPQTRSAAESWEETLEGLAGGRRPLRVCPALTVLLPGH